MTLDILTIIIIITKREVTYTHTLNPTATTGLLGWNDAHIASPVTGKVNTFFPSLTNISSERVTINIKLSCE